MSAYYVFKPLFNLVAHPHDTLGFRATEPLQCKAQLEGNAWAAPVVPLSRAATKHRSGSVAPFGRGCLRPQTTLLFLDIEWLCLRKSVLLRSQTVTLNSNVSCGWATSGYRAVLAHRCRPAENQDLLLYQPASLFAGRV